MNNKTTNIGVQHALYFDIYEQLKKDIIEGKYPQGSMLPTEKELAETHFVSRITIRKAMDMLKKGNYITRIAGRGTFVNKYTEPKKGSIIGVILCNVAYSFGLGILLSIEQAAAQKGYSIIFKNSRDSAEEETNHINELVELGVEGIIIQPVHNEFYNETLIQLHFNDFPIVLVDRSFLGFSIPSVCTNSFETAFIATNYLFDKGYENIVFISSPIEHSSTLEERINGFTAAYAAKKRLLNSNNLLNTLKSPQDNTADNNRLDVELIKNFLASAKEMKAIITSEFTITKLAFQAVKEMNRNIPADYALIMYDDYETIADFDVTRILQDQEQIGIASFETLHQKINKNIVSNKIYTPFKIIHGSTTPNISKYISLKI